MKTINLSSSRIRICVIICSILLTFCSSPVESNNLNSVNDELLKILSETEIEELSEGEVAGLLFMREEEKLARDIYIKLYELWNIRVFDNISQSEQRHMDAVKILLDRYSLTDPIGNNEIGIFENSDLHDLYEKLMAQGSNSVSDALKVGAAIEEIDILDLEKQLNEVADNEDIKLVYSNLLSGSKNHLRAFVRNIDAQGEEYSPVYLDIDNFDTIINSENERGNKSRGKGNKCKM